MVVSLVALALSVASLTWQVAAHRLTGHRVVVHMGTSIPVGGAEQVVPICRTITTENRGRAAVTVNAVALDVGGGRSAQVALHFVDRLSDGLPVRLEPGSSASWAFPIDVDEEIAAQYPRSRAMVTLGDGHRKYSGHR